MKRSAAEMTTATLTADWLAYAEVCTRDAPAMHPLYTRAAHPRRAPTLTPNAIPSRLHGSNMRCRRTV